ncbi:uncharacterized protein LOC121872916 isoform X2 [Homarus americanus]|uniref:uncharacterized protein LOC121872916 isoform X2 n=1 Tax=Homarus americanus TaxID=6706 RepID=UPI001C47F928|nr:uncharacterized protein LOC121872916 isoform X2 [Homarus americanus]
MARTDLGHHHRWLPASGVNEEEEGLLAGDLGCGPGRTQLLDQLAKEEYYSSVRFAVGYQELQARWSTDWATDGFRVMDTSQPSSRTNTSHLSPLDESPVAPSCPLHDDSPKGQHSFLHSLQKSSKGSSSSRADMPTRKHSLLLPLPEFSAASSSGYVDVGDSRWRRSRRWGSSTDCSPLGTPSPLLSTAPSPIASSPSTSLTSSPRRIRARHRDTIGVSSCTSSPGCALSSGSYCCGDDEGPSEELHDDHSAEGRRGGLLEAIRRVLHNLRRRPQQHTTTPLHGQVAELEAELESYKQLSVAKRQAADLLKHQLMEALYEQVVRQVEEKHRRRQLEQELMALEFEVHQLRSTTRRQDFNDLDTQLLKAFSEKQLIRRQLGSQLIHDVSHPGRDVNHHSRDVTPQLDDCSRVINTFIFSVVVVLQMILKGLPVSYLLK